MTTVLGLLNNELEIDWKAVLAEILEKLKDIPAF
jgi:hypothetical protein